MRLDGRIAATAGWDGTVRLFDLRKELRPLAELRHHRNGAVHAVAFATRPPAARSPHCTPTAAAWSAPAMTGR